ncbi:MAG: extracellular solute-binding protein [Caldilineaceae bacterium]
MKRLLLTISLLMAMLIVLGACAAPAPAAEPAAADANADAAAADDGSFNWQRFDGAEITVLIAEHPVADGMRELLPEFEAATGIKVNIEAMAEDLYFDRMELALRAETGVADVYFQPMDSTAFTQWSADLIAPLSPYINDAGMTADGYDLADFPAGFLSATTYPPGSADAQNFGIPVSFEAYILFYNKDIVDQYLGGELPGAMDELVAAARRINEEAGGEVAGAVMRGIRSDTTMDTVTGMVYNRWGADAAPLPYNVWFDGDWNNPRVTDARITAGLADYAGMMQAGPPNIQALDWPDASLLFSQGRAAFFIDASLFGPGFEDEAASAVAGKVGYAVLPPAAAGGDSYTGHWMWGLGIPANAPNPDAGWYFIQWMTSKQSEPRIGAFHGGAARVSTWDDEGYKNALNPEYVDAVLTAMQSSRTTVVFREGWKEFALEISDSIQQMYSGADPAAVTAALQEKFMSMGQ